MATNYHSQELEIKVLEIDPRDVRIKLVSLGATKRLESLNQTMCFDIQGRVDYTSVPLVVKEIVQLAEALAARGKTLRELNYFLRAVKTGNHYEFMLKYGTKQVPRLRMHSEKSVILSPTDWQDLKLNMLKAGIRIVAIQEQRCTYFDMSGGKVKFELVEPPGLPVYVTIRSKSEKLVYDWVRKLGLDGKNSTTLTGEKFLELYGIGVHTNLLFNMPSKE